MREPFKLLDLFSGIGGFSLGLERSGGFKTVAFCEIDPFCRRVLAKHWTEVSQYHDVRELTGNQLISDGIAVDAICGGFPCQDVSSAGTGRSIDGERSGLWWQYRRLISEIRPKVVIVENVAELLGRGFDRVLGSLESLGYDAEWHCIPASALGFPHQRDRVWIVAHAAALRREKGGRREESWGRIVWPWIHGRAHAAADAANDDEIRSRFVRIVDGVPDRVDRLGALGNAVVPQIPEIIGRAILQSMESES